jgi:hypothetical protein
LIQGDNVLGNRGGEGMEPWSRVTTEPNRWSFGVGVTWRYLEGGGENVVESPRPARDAALLPTSS